MKLTPTKQEPEKKSLIMNNPLIMGTAWGKACTCKTCQHGSALLVVVMVSLSRLLYLLLGGATREERPPNQPFGFCRA